MALTIQIFVSKVMSLLFNTLFRFLIAFLPRSKPLLISWLQSLSAVILEPKKIKSAFVSIATPSICHEVMGPDAMILVFWTLSFKPAFHSPLSPSSRSSLVPLSFLPLEWYHLHVQGCVYFFWQSWFQLVLRPAWHFAWCTVHVSYISRVAVYSLDVLLSQFGTSPLFLCLVGTVDSWSVYRFLRRQVWSSIPISLRIFQFVVIHTVRGFSIVNEAEVDVFLEFPCFFHVPTNVGNSTSGSSAFSKPSLYISKFSVHVLLKPNLKDFELYVTFMWNERNCMVVWTFLGTAFLWDWNENWPFSVLWPLLSFPNLLAYWVQHFAGTSCKMLGWMKHKLESRLPGEISITSDTQITPPLWQKTKKN